ncbi:MAG: hypothetical protein J5605_00425 [Bacteroidales bacterium]|nr:hypothetical protein [Bacteroidales bacterium]
MKILLTLLFPLLSLLVSSPEDMYSVYDKDGQYQAMTEQMEQITQQSEAAEQERSEKKTFVLVISLLLGIIPIAVVGKKIYRERSWESNPAGMWRAIAIAVAGGAVLFAINYGVFYLKLIHNEVFQIVFPAAIALAVIVGAFVYWRR